MIWEWNIGTNSVECIQICKGHERGVDCIAINPSAQKMATGSWDTLLKIWSALLYENEGDETVSKKSKTTHASTRVNFIIKIFL